MERWNGKVSKFFLIQEEEGYDVFTIEKYKRFFIF